MILSGSSCSACYFVSRVLYSGQPQQHHPNYNHNHQHQALSAPAPAPAPPPPTTSTTTRLSTSTSTTIAKKILTVARAVHPSVAFPSTRLAPACSYHTISISLFHNFYYPCSIYATYPPPSAHSRLQCVYSIRVVSILSTLSTPE